MEQYNYFNLKAVLLYIRPTCFKLFNTLWQDDGKKISAALSLFI